ncbi:Antiholin-like protein LrgB [Carnimonas sp. R-84981]|uniref:LrgB family protein n=1 Tax=Carnimonas bestiolae TaxID=3402172 RepID=UPI003EDBA0AB
MKVTSIDSLWVYLSASPLLSLFLTAAAYLGSYYLIKHFKLLSKLNLQPAVLAIAALIAVLALTHTSYDDYFAGAQFIHFLLGPATVMLAVPIYDNLARIRMMMAPMLLGIAGAVLASAFLTIGLSMLFHLPAQMVASFAPKSVTTPIAMGVSQSIGGIPALTAALSLITGIVGCFTGPLVFKLTGAHDHVVKGFTMGSSCHGFGTAQSFASISVLAGAFSGLAMGCVGLATALILPFLQVFMR